MAARARPRGDAGGKVGAVERADLLVVGALRSAPAGAP